MSVSREPLCVETLSLLMTSVKDLVKEVNLLPTSVCITFLKLLFILVGNLFPKRSFCS